MVALKLRGGRGVCEGRKLAKFHDPRPRHRLPSTAVSAKKRSMSKEAKIAKTRRSEFEVEWRLNHRTRHTPCTTANVLVMLRMLAKPGHCSLLGWARLEVLLGDNRAVPTRSIFKKKTIVGPRPYAINLTQWLPSSTPYRS